MIDDFLNRFFGCHLSDFRTGACPQTVRHGDAELNATIGPGLGHGLGIGIRDNEFDPLKLRLDHVVDSIATCAADADDSYTGPQMGFHFRDRQIDGHC